MSRQKPPLDFSWETAVERLSARLKPFVRQRLGRELSSRLDSTDVVQSALGSLYRVTGPDPGAAGDWHRLWGLAAVIATRKCQRQAERHRAARRDVRRDVAAFDMIDPHGCEPVAEAALKEALSNLLARFESHEQTMLVSHLEGFSAEEIATRAGCTSRTVRRLLERARMQFLQQESCHE